MAPTMSSMPPTAAPTPSPPSSPRVLIADDEVLLRDGLGMLLTSSGFEVTTVEDAGQLMRAVDGGEYDLAIIDIRMPPTHTTEGIDAATWLRAHHPDVAVLVLSSHLEVEHAIDLLAGGGGMGYLLKQRVTAVDEFVLALHRLLAGETVIDPALVQELLHARRAIDPLEALTPRELQVLENMAKGRSNAGIAGELRLTEATVEKYVHRILAKLGLTDNDAEQHRRVLAVIAYLDLAGSRRV